MVGDTIPMIVPQLGNAMDEISVTEWYVEVGDRVQEGDEIVLIDSDKAQSELEAPATGTISAILVQDGATANVGDQLAIVMLD
jgi:pyruvate/2-oxoglutarate dehydrogenase complex dihydrolipoamide acyltransferase (E2) component